MQKQFVASDDRLKCTLRLNVHAADVIKEARDLLVTYQGVIPQAASRQTAYTAAFLLHS